MFLYCSIYDYALRAAYVLCTTQCIVLYYIQTYFHTKYEYNRLLVQFTQFLLYNLTSYWHRNTSICKIFDSGAMDHSPVDAEHYLFN